ncbi:MULTISPECIES: HNH endonuclease family protein [Asaia]|uniref:hypothetical protein n=1 Tax=Asaia TaxID=91914 RepID=UPI0003D3284B|nr:MULTISPECIES: hypothetical protein [Asaia]ETC97753.1 hypothetical protein P792_13960 [Asaia sp. SF2.1]
MLTTAVCELVDQDKMALRTKQDEIDRVLDFKTRVGLAKQLFNDKSRVLFSRVRAALAVASGDLVRCGYCEDSCADEVEHVWPKNFYPGRTFDHSNYMFVCGICNPAKNDKFSVRCEGEWLDLPTQRKVVGFVDPLSTESRFIDPLSEDPLDFLWLDILAGTFMIVPIHDPGTLEYERADYTINVLRLNKEDLVEARKNAYTGFCDRMHRYVDCKLSGEGQPQLDHRLLELRRAPHQTVRKEMQRQSGVLDAPHPAIESALEVFS